MRTTTRRFVALIAIVLLPVSLLAACGDDDEEGSPAVEETFEETTTTAAADDAAGGGAGSEAAERIVAEGFAFEVGTAVSPGATVAVSNRDAAPHTVTADEGDAFDVRIEPEGEATLTAPQEPGEYAFHCEIHPNMKGTLVVE